jgi:hypothetical protein
MRYIKIILLALLPSVVSGQTLINVYQSNGTQLHIPMASVDSSRFNTNGGVTFQKIFQSNLNVLSIATNSIDSITYTVPVQANLPVLTTTAAQNITSFSAVAGGNISSMGADTILQRGICWSTHMSPTLADNHTTDGLAIGSYTSSMLPLISNTTYYIRAYATNSYGTAYGNELTFSTLSPAGDLPTVISAVLSDTTGYSVNGGGEVTSDGGSAVVARGICWASGVTPTINNSFTVDGSGAGVYSSMATGLMANTTYFVRAYATNIAGTAYGNAYTVTTYEWPVVKILEIKDIKPTYYTIRGTVLDDKGLNITEIGLALGVDQYPTAEENKRFARSSVSEFEAWYTDWFGQPFQLVSNTRYHLRAYTISQAGIIYGDTMSIVMAPAYPEVETYEVIEAGGKSATLGGHVISSDGAPITLRGICYSKNTSVGIHSDTVISTNDTGAFSLLIADLDSNTTYYFRAFAMNDSFEVKYGNTKSFKTCDVPTVGALQRITMYADSAYMKSVVFSDGGCNVTAKGIVLSRAGRADTMIYFTSILGDYFATKLLDLQPGTDYNARAFAVNDAGIGYGPEMSFSTLKCVDGLCVGQEYQGGYISYILEPGDAGYDADTVHGIICIKDYTMGSSWGCYGTNLSLTGTNGKELTEQIMAQSCNTTSSAASRCYNLVRNGYSDWYLPTGGELGQVFDNLVQNGIGGTYLKNTFWTSEQCSAQGARFCNLSNVDRWYSYCVPNACCTPHKNSNLSVLAIRYF